MPNNRLSYNKKRFGGCGMTPPIEQIRCECQNKSIIAERDNEAFIYVLCQECKKKIVIQPLKDSIDVALDTLKSSIITLPTKQQNILKEWLEIWSKYLDFENTFDPKRLIYYKRGDIVLVQFGYNVGNELCGVHYAVVVEKNNNHTRGLVTVVPLSSLDDDKTEDDLHKSEVFLGQIIGDVDCYAIPLQIRTVSKLRIIKPKYKKHGKITINSELLDKIDVKIKSIFTK